MPEGLLRFNGGRLRDPAVEAWFDGRRGELGAMARRWFEVMRGCGQAEGEEVCELVHDGCAVACLGDVPFASVNVFTSHVNVAFFLGAGLDDPAGLLEGSGKRMRHVKLRAGVGVDEAALRGLIEAAWADVRARVGRGE